MSESRDFVGVIVAAGRATRFGGRLPKQFADLGGRTILDRSTSALVAHPALRGAVVVLAEHETTSERGRAIAAHPSVLAVVPGGETRAESVSRGLASVDAPFVLVHDAARPLVSPALVDAVVAATRRGGAAVPAIPVPDTVKRVDTEGRIAETVERSSLRLAQTPQGARRDWLSAALERASRDGVTVTDEAAALERDGHPIELVPGEPSNRKITTVDDLEWARRLEVGFPDLRVGTGFDIHAIDSERRLVLGGVEFPEGPGLSGHSDADVVLHAAMDALLGAAGLGDIGVHFPPEDTAFAGADSRELAREVARMIKGEGWSVVNLDLTLLAERPKIRGRLPEMRESIGASLGIPASRVGLKATTLERLGALGRGEGMACEAVALLRREGPAVHQSQAGG